ncbi:Lrp/AsnC family transcriptional regulator [Natrinema sp. 1APR25-10V2]|uniref:Lrp/AsnC family transcriptional regulator n=1 Tax=Natrinema sp. 1APR25-10V2 TaxID=2951081 RepID=UPI00287447B7|nr:Lrp/AsnC family transcriptional regulator [Natrinema sp. 1APR25-10V2]MDS0476796.1 Lrp/AsnC family transcriptional regulator [Natrinema sp. 1APR25-10V2]
MSEGPLDDLDRRIVHSLQQNARKTSASEIAEQAGVSASTVRNRIQNLEAAGILTGYRPEVNYEAASYQLQTLIVCTAPVPEREVLAKKALEVPGVVAVREIMTGTENVHVEAIGSDGDDLSRIGRDLDEIGLEVVDEDLIRNEYECAFHGFDVKDV